MLRAKKPADVERRLKLFIFGPAKSGKTLFSLNFPKPYLIDTERGSECPKYRKALEDRDGVRYQTSSYDDLIIEVKSLISEKHDYKTLIIDPITTIYENVLNSEMTKKLSPETAKKTNPNAFGKPFADTNKKMKVLTLLLLRLDMNVILTSHIKEKFDDRMAKIGETFDCWKKQDYLFDLILKTQKDYTAVVEGSRFENFERGEIIPIDFSLFSEKFEKEYLLRETKPYHFVSTKDLAEINSLVKSLNVPDEIVQKWIEKAEVDALSDLGEEEARKILEYLRAKTNESNKIAIN